MELSPIALWLNTACASMDEGIALAIHKLFEAAGGFFTPLMVFISALGKLGIFLIALGAVLVWFRKTRKMGTAILLGLAIGLLIVNIAVKPLVARPRPFSYDGSVLQQIWIDTGRHLETDFSFPSGHMNAASAASMAVFLAGNRKKSWLVFFFAIAMGISRVYLGIHYATDVFGGAITGGVSGVLGYIVACKLPPIWYELDFPTLLNRKGGGGGGKHLSR